MPPHRVLSISEEESLRRSAASPVSTLSRNTLTGGGTSQVGNGSPSPVSMGPRPSSSAKVAIPPLRHRVHTPPAATDKKRTAKACAECRSRKIKCSGRQPTCDHCDQLQLPCVYNDGKRERHKKGLERGDRMLQLLRDLSASVHLPADMRSRIKALESEVPEDDLSIASTASHKRLLTVGATASNKRPRSRSPGTEQTQNAEAFVSADVGSQQSVDLVGEDLNQTEQTRATGFIGKVSDVAWAQRLARVQNSHAVDEFEGQGVWGRTGNSERAKNDRLDAIRRRHAPENLPKDKVSDYNYHTDSEDVLLLSNVDKDELPPAEMATNMCESYMENVQCMFPALSKSDFMSQFKMYLRSLNPESLPAKWRAILNLVFAIGARFSHLSEAPWRGDDRDHLIYYTRARHLGFNGETMLEHPDIQGIQVLALISFYYLAIGQVSRAWVMVGSACRHAVALGLHLRSETPTIPPVQKEKRVRVWWSLYRLDHVLCEITGRPPAINHLFASVPVPGPVEEDNVSPALDRMNLEDQVKGKPKMRLKEISMTICFRHQILLAIIAQKVFVKLYSAATVTESWETARNAIIALSEEMDQWYSNLPPHYQFSTSTLPGTIRERTLLGFSFYSTKILLNRPCLCRIDLRIRNIGQNSKVVNDERSRECVRAARSMADLLPDDAEPDVLWLYRNGPWWCIVHHLMQAITVFMLELAFELHHMTEPKADRDAILGVLKKLIKWLEKMSNMGNATARGACEQIRAQLRGFTSSKDSKIHAFAQMVFPKPMSQADDSPLQTPRPPSWQSQSSENFESHGQYQTVTSESAGYFGQFHRDQHGVSLDQITAHMTQRRQMTRQSYNLESWQQLQQQNYAQNSAAANLDLFQDRSHFDAGPAEPWEIHPDPTWGNLMWQTSHDQFNPFGSVAGSWVPPQMMGLEQQPQYAAAGMHVAVGMDMDTDMGMDGMGAGQTQTQPANMAAMAASFSRGLTWPEQQTQPQHHTHPYPHHRPQRQQPQHTHTQHQWHLPPPPDHHNPYAAASTASDDYPYDHPMQHQHEHLGHVPNTDGYEAAAALEHAQSMERERERHDASRRHEPYLN